MFGGYTPLLRYLLLSIVQNSELTYQCSDDRIVLSVLFIRIYVHSWKSIKT